MVIFKDLSTLSEKNRVVYEQLDAPSDRLGPPWLEHNKRIGYLRRCQAFKENTARHRKRKPVVPLAYHGMHRELHPTKTDGLWLSYSWSTGLSRRPCTTRTLIHELGRGKAFAYAYLDGKMARKARLTINNDDNNPSRLSRKFGSDTATVLRLISRYDHWSN